MPEPPHLDLIRGLPERPLKGEIGRLVQEIFGYGGTKVLNLATIPSFNRF